MSPSPSVEFVIPVLNEERALPGSVERLHGFLSQTMQACNWRIVVADNGSTDRTPLVCEELSRRFEEVGYLRLEERGRGRALRTAWLASDADYLGYMDVDLSTELEAIPPLVESLATGGYDIAIGSRLKKGANVIGRSLKREVVSRCYNLIIRSMFFVRFRDAQCGFKAIKRDAARELAPLVMDNTWFFDTELLILPRMATACTNCRSGGRTTRHASEDRQDRVRRHDGPGSSSIRWAEKGFEAAPGREKVRAGLKPAPTNRR